MKILSLKARNINSLKGSTEVDFEALTKESALFAITGATGSGKSTLLDIISCALYGRTARLKNPNDLMSRHAGEAYCEVEFEVHNKRYRSSWSQKRARKHHDGKFQTAKMELVDLDENKILPLKSREVPKKVEALSGLDFGRFTQSMLLAQGSFDAFLKADEKERSALLEKITGTQIYADVSIAIFEKHRTLASELELQKKSLQSIEFLDPEDLFHKELELQRVTEQKEQTQESIKSILEELHWLQRVSTLEEEYVQKKRNFESTKEKKEGMQEQFMQLDLANRALNVWATFQTHKQLEKEVLTLEKKCLTLEEEEKESSITRVNASEAHLKSQKNFSTFLEHFTKESQKLKEARVIQTQESSTKELRAKSETLFAIKAKQQQKQHDRVSSLNEQKEHLVKSILQAKEYLQFHKEDAKLLESLGVIEQKIAYFLEQKEKQRGYEISSQKLQKELLLTQKEYEKSQNELLRLTSNLEQLEEAYTSLQKTPFNAEDTEVKIHKGLQQTQELQHNYKEYKKLLQIQEQEKLVLQESSKSLTFLRENRRVVERHIAELKSHIETLREKETQERLLQKYEEDRAKLVEGEACFLCGATQHPFVNEAPKLMQSNIEKQIHERIAELENQERELQTLLTKEAETNIKEQSKKVELEKLEQQLQEREHYFNEQGLNLSCVNEETFVEKEANILQEQRAFEDYKVQKAELVKSKEQGVMALQKQERLFYENNLQLQKIETEAQSLSTLLDESTKNIQRVTQLLKEIFEEFNIVFYEENPQKSFEQLQERKECYERELQTLQKLQEQDQLLSLEQIECVTQKQALEQEREALQKEIESLKDKEKLLQCKRVETLNVANLDVYEQELEREYKKLQKSEEEFRSSLERLQVQAEERLVQKEELKVKLQEQHVQIEALQKELQELYRENSFMDAEELQAAMLEKEQREQLRNLCQHTEASYKSAEALLQESLKQLTLAKEEKKSTMPLEALESLKALLEQKADALAQSLGSLSKELELHRANSKKFQKEMQLLHKQEESFKVWVKLNELVGSADGTKFKKFAQGITLEQLIFLANEHLKVLSTRYILTRSDEKLLELEIIDAYQGNVVRPVSTLSGGESFIVSLALALGLSELASQKISIDSLFLDEGFGTLDAESLETALNALNLLQSGGKMVGVISHVEALKERIPLQIKVIPRGDGTSFVQIP